MKKCCNSGESLIHIGLQLDLQPGTLFERFLAEPAEGLEIHHVDIINSNEAMRLLQHKSFGNDVGVNLIRLGLSDVVLPEGCGLDRVEYTDFMTLIDKVTDKVIAVVSR